MELTTFENFEALDISQLENIDGGWTPGGMFWAMGTGAGGGALTGAGFGGPAGAIAGAILGACGGAVNYAVSDYLK